MTTSAMSHDTRPVGWAKAAQRTFKSFPATVQDRVGTALTIAAEGGKADIAKPLKGLGSGVMQIATARTLGGWSM